MNTTVMQEYREKSGLTYDQIAESTGLAKSTVSRLFTDPNYNPTIDTVHSVLVLIGGSIDRACDMTTITPTADTDLTTALDLATAQTNRLYAECTAQKKVYHRIMHEIEKGDRTIKSGAARLNMSPNTFLRRRREYQNHTGIFADDYIESED